MEKYATYTIEILNIKKGLILKYKIRYSSREKIFPETKGNIS